MPMPSERYVKARKSGTINTSSNRFRRHTEPPQCRLKPSV
ncbi:Sensor protein [Neisseria gonorrhoeae NCCP11945]|uniref:Sensor protein n=1 Tax=Neisseria gonorrhoeae (strain NCCP11945) TaxID=521006 RepID=B4RJ32_NEIG2|nr:Sensor protein [Neisseria gonorrhoeae NCCP11945]